MNDVILKPIRPSAAVEAWYRRKLQDLAYEMAKSMLVHLRAAWKEADPDIGFGHDESPTVTLRRALDKWGEKAIRKFNRASRDIARAFANKSMRDFDGRFRRILRNAGFTVKFRPTELMVETYRTVLAENVALIRSIPQKFLTDVESKIWIGVMKGSDMAGLEKAIKLSYGVAWRRAAFIARDQVSKARASMESTRRKELGITEAIWLHSHAGHAPRPTHVAMNGRRYKVDKGMWDSAAKAWVWPGTLPNCRCVSKSVFEEIA